MYTTLLQQYQLVISARGALFDYLDTMDPKDLTKSVPTHNNDSMAVLLFHSANTYIWWLGNFALKQQRSFYGSYEYAGFNSVKAAFESVDLLMNDFLQHFKDELNTPFTILVEEGLEQTATPLQLFTHVITHEFHHKGQIVNMSRQLGYIPVDTDAYRT